MDKSINKYINNMYVNEYINKFIYNNYCSSYTNIYFFNMLKSILIIYNNNIHSFIYLLFIIFIF